MAELVCEYERRSHLRSNAFSGGKLGLPTHPMKDKVVIIAARNLCNVLPNGLGKGEVKGRPLDRSNLACGN